MNPRPPFRRPSLGSVLGVLALIVALAGTANAGSTHLIVRKGDIAKGAVTASALAKGAVTGKALRKGAVGASALAPGSVGSGALKSGSVTPAALAPNAVTAMALAPASVYGGAIGPVVVHSASITDRDESADLSTWTMSDTATALCSPGEKLLTGGVIILSPGNNRVAVARSLPAVIGASNGYTGQITSDSGGTATAEVQAICLK